MAKHAKRITQKQSCEGKEKLTERAANGKVSRLMKTTGARVHAYRCKFKCYLADGSRSWHVGHRT